MKKTIILATLAVLFFFACSGDKSAGSSASGNKAVAATQKKPDGAKIYKQYCVTCHGLYGDMGASGAFNLQTSTLSKEERIQVITKGRNLMTAFENLLSPEKIEAVAEYVETLRE
jgi:mono/diheme cytochrome c family protein